MKFLKLILLILPMNAIALTMDESEVGKSFYHGYSMGKVEIVSRDYSDWTVKIKFSDGKTKWVKPHELMAEVSEFEEAVNDLGGTLFMDDDDEEEGASKLVKETAVQGRAGLNICNDLDRRIDIAFGKRENSYWITDGWYGIESGKCKSVISNQLKHQYYFINVQDSYNDDHLLKHDANLCMHPTDGFTLNTLKNADAESCKYPYKSHPVRRIDTGKNARYYKLTIQK